MPDKSIPLMPLKKVLFPRQEIVLQIFEDRYKEMLTYCAENNVEFGVVLIDSGEEVGGEAIPHGVGTTVKIREIVPTRNNRILLTGYGDKRFQINTNVSHVPYPQADVSFNLPTDLHENKSNSVISPNALFDMIWESYIEVLTMRDALASSWRKIPDARPNVHKFCNQVGAITEGYAPDLLRQDLLSTYDGEQRLPVANTLLHEAKIKIKKQLNFLQATRFGGTNRN